MSQQDVGSAVTDFIEFVTGPTGILILLILGCLICCCILGCVCRPVRRFIERKRIERAHRNTRRRMQERGHVPIKYLTLAAKETYVCVYPGCGREFKSQFDWKMHRRDKEHFLDTDTDVRKCDYPGCFRKFLAQAKLDAHKKEAGHGAEAHQTLKEIDIGLVGTLFVKIIECRNVSASDSLDSYVVVEKKPKKRRTKLVKQSASPLFDEMIAFEGARGELRLGVVRFHPTAADKLLGKVTFDLKKTVPKPRVGVEKWFELVTPDTKEPIGHVHIMLYWSAAACEAPNLLPAQDDPPSGGARPIDKKKSLRVKKKSIRRKKSSDQLGGQFPCPHCANLYEDADMRRKHVELRHKEEALKASEGNSRASARGSGQAFRCADCGNLYENDELLQRHRQLRHDEKPPPRKETRLSVAGAGAVGGMFRCVECGKDYETQDLLSRHQQLRHSAAHSIDSTVKNEFKCVDCAQTYETLALLKRHRELRHSGIEEKSALKASTYVCVECGQDYESRALLNRHQELRHKGGNARDSALRSSAQMSESADQTDASFKCPHCAKSYDSKELLTRHQQLRHAEARLSAHVYSCPHCPKTYNSNELRDRHVALRHVAQRNTSNPMGTLHESSSEEGEKSAHLCPLCGMECGSDEFVSLHMDLKHADEMKKQRAAMKRAAKSADGGERIDSIVEVNEESSDASSPPPAPPSLSADDFPEVPSAPTQTWGD